VARHGTHRQSVTGLGGRAILAWRAMVYEQRLAVGACLGLFVTLFLPWYQETLVTAKVQVPVTATLSGWAAFSWVEAAVLLVCVGVITLVFQRAEGRAFHLPGGDGFVIMAAGAWTCALVVWRIFDKQSMTTVRGPGITTIGIEWGIFVALAVGGLLAYSGSRLRAAHRPEPPLPGELEPVREAAPPELPPDDAASVTVRRERPTGWLSAPPRHRAEDPTVADGEQLTIPLDAGEPRG